MKEKIENMLRVLEEFKKKFEIILETPLDQEPIVDQQKIDSPEVQTL